MGDDPPTTPSTGGATARPTDRPTEDELAEAIATATDAALCDLRASRPDERLYYVSLITSGEALRPGLCVDTVESLRERAGGDPEELAMLRWSYAEVPDYPVGEEHFDPVDELFGRHVVLDLDRPVADWEAEVSARLRAMERAIAELDRRGRFGTGPARSQVLVNVEVMPPDETNTERAKRLNPPEAISDWLREAAE